MLKNITNKEVTSSSLKSMLTFFCQLFKKFKSCHYSEDVSNFSICNPNETILLHLALNY